MRILIDWFFIALYSFILGIYTFVSWFIYKLNQPHEADYGMWSFEEEITVQDWDDLKLLFYTVVIVGYIILFLIIYFIHKLRKRKGSKK